MDQTPQKSNQLDKSLLSIECTDCLDGLRNLDNESVDLVFTSPPYADRRKKSYDSIPERQYSQWFIPIALEIKRVLKKKGSFFLNLNPHCSRGERSLYVYELVLAMRNLIGFKFIDEYVWYKSAAPRKRGPRLRDAWEPIYHFSLDTENIFVDHDGVQTQSKHVFTNKRGYVGLDSITGNVGGYHDIADQSDGLTEPDNVLYFPTSYLVHDKYPHPAKFPLQLAQFFVKRYCPAGGVVCDPFMGSGMTALAALIDDKQVIGFDTKQEYCDMVMDRIENYQPPNKPKSKRGRDIFSEKYEAEFC